MLFFRSLAVSLGVFALLGEIGYYYFLPTQKPAQVKQEKIPYSHRVENAGIMFNFSESKTFVYLNFEAGCVNLLLDETQNPENYGYSVDYTVEGDYALLGGIVDCVDGIDLERDSEILTFTGVQIAEMLETTVCTTELRKELASAIFYSISERDFLREDFLYIIENSTTNLTVPDCYYWQGSVKDLCKNVRIID